MTTTIPTAIQSLLNTLGEDIVTTGDALTARRFADWSGVPAQTPLALLRPRTTEQVAQALSICHQYKQPVVAQGGLSGLAGAACTGANDVALSLERMAAIEEVDPANRCMTVQAGAVLQTVQQAAAAHGLLFALDLGARGSATLGGNLATNAGGVNVIQYGMAREQVLDLEAVLADGRIIGGQRKMLKNNTGLDLKQLLIGSEGTLGIITRATLKLRPLATATMTAWCGLPDYAAVIALLNRAQQTLPQGVCAFEVMWPGYYEYVLGQLAHLKRPLTGQHAFYVLLESQETSTTATLQASLESLLADCLAQGIVTDAVLAQSTAQAQDFWRVREAPEHFPRLMPELIAFDVSFAIHDIDDAAQACTHALRQRWPHCTILAYGHLGDGNLHLVVDVPDAPDDVSTHPRPALATQVEDLVYQIVARYHGSVSAEHGIGLKKQAVLAYSRSASELAVMRSIKHALDPHNILNRGKLFAGAE